MEKFFKIKERGSSIRTEIIAGLTTFFALAYIIFVNPSILEVTGISWGGVFVATIIAAALGTLLIGLLANVPYAMAPGMGLNAFFAYTVCLGMGFAWQEALAMVFLCGVLSIILTLTRLRTSILLAVPENLRLAIGAGIGLFIAYIGLKNGGVLYFTGTGNDAVPGLGDFSDKAVLVTLIGLAITAILMVLKVRGALLISIVATTIVALIMGVTALPGKVVDIGAVGEINDVAFKLFGNPGLGSLFSDSARILPVIATIIAFMLTDIFDTIGTFLGTGIRTGIFTDESFEKMKKGKGFEAPIERGLFADCTATAAGAVLGTSNVTTYIESAAGIEEGGKTGFSSIITAAALLLCLPFAPLVGIVPSQATAPILIIVGVLMVTTIGRIKWNEFDEALPAFLTIIVMPMAYSISHGIAFGFIAYCLTKLIGGKAKTVHPLIYIFAGFFILNYILTAIL